MPKMSNDWSNIPTGSKADRSKKKNSNLKSEDIFLRTKVGDEIRGRFIGGWMQFIAHWPRVDEGDVDAKGAIVWKNSTFPDAKDRNYKPTRICTDDTPMKERKQDIKGYLKKTKCVWCKLKFQGYHGNVRFALNIITRPDYKCQILEIPPTPMEELGKLCEKYKKIMPEGPGDVSRKVLEFVFNRPAENKWDVKRYENLDVDEPSLSADLVELTAQDIAALKFINPDAENEEDYLKGHDLEFWYRKDYMSAEWQEQIFKKIIELSPYDKAKGTSDIVEEFEKEIDESEEVEEIEEVEESVDVEPENVWGDVDLDEDEDEEDTDTKENTEDDDDDSPLW